MDIKLKTSGMLLRKLAFGCGDAQLQAVAEIRLYAKYDDENRACLGRAGAIGPLIKLMRESPEARVQENAMFALLNISINPENKMRMVREQGNLEAVIQLAKQAASREVNANAAALLYSLVADTEARKIASTNENLWSTLIEILRDGSAKCKGEALKALFVAAGDNLIREKLLQEDLHTISLLISIVSVGKVKLTEDCLAVLALLASWEAGASAIARVSNSIPVLVYLVSSGTSPRVQENAASVLLNICQNDREALRMMPSQALVPALNRIYWGGSERGKGKAEALLGLLGFDQALSQPIDPNSDVSCSIRANTMPFLAPHPHASARPLLLHQSSPSDYPPSSSRAPHSNASSPKTKTSNSSKYFGFAKSFFSHRPRKRSQSISS